MEKKNSLKQYFFKDGVTTCATIVLLALIVYCVAVAIMMPIFAKNAIYAGRFAIALAAGIAVYLLLAAVRDGFFARKPLSFNTGAERLACIVVIVIVVTLIAELILGNAQQLFRRIVFYVDAILTVVTVVLLERARLKASK